MKFLFSLTLFASITACHPASKPKTSIASELTKSNSKTPSSADASEDKTKSNESKADDSTNDEDSIIDNGDDARLDEVDEEAEDDKQKGGIEVGGFAKVSKTDKAVLAASEFAVSAIATKIGAAVKLVDIKSAEKQIVAGTNYKISLVLEIEDKTELHEVVVYEKFGIPGGVFQLSSDLTVK